MSNMAYAENISLFLPSNGILQNFPYFWISIPIFFSFPYFRHVSNPFLRRLIKLDD